MESPDEVKSRRIHIGNISPKLAENGASLQARLEKFGQVTKPLLFHTKPVNDFYFAFVNIDLSDKSFEKLKSALNGILFMGRKLLISLAKSDFKESWEKDSRRPGPSKKDIQKHERIAQARALRIAESQRSAHTNFQTGAPIFRTSLVSPSNSSTGYHKSAHTFNNTSGNTKNKSPAHDLIGSKSYGTLTAPRSVYGQQYSRSNGGGEIVKGRIRKTARPQAYFVRKEQTLRTLINGELKQIKSYKTKLWGVEKNKTAIDLSYSYENNAWRSGDGHIVERVAIKKIPEITCGMDASQAENYGKLAVHEESVEEIGNSTKYEQEQATNASVLAKLFTNYDFDKPAELEEDSDEENVTYDSKGRKTVQRFDYETQGVVNFDDDDDQSEQEDAEPENAKALVEEFINSHQRPSEVVYDEDDEGNEIDLDELGQHYATEAIKTKYDEEHDLEDGSVFEVNADNGDKSDAMEVDPKSETEDHEEDGEEDSEEDSEEGLMPTFGQPAPENNTETLRSLFNQPAEAGFSLQVDEEDIDDEAEKEAENERQKLLEQIKQKQKEQQTEAPVTTTKRNQFGLFWSHFASPFLQTQTQLSKVGHVGEIVRLPGEDESLVEQEIRDDGHGDEDAYERWFWSVRGDVGRECKRRKRDVMRTFRKKSVRPSV